MPESRRQELHDSSLGMLDYVASGVPCDAWRGELSTLPRASRNTVASRLVALDRLHRQGVTGRIQYSLPASIETLR